MSGGGSKKKGGPNAPEGGPEGAPEAGPAELSRREFMVEATTVVRAGSLFYVGLLQSPGPLGDVNGDGRTNVADLVALVQEGEAAQYDIPFIVNQIFSAHLEDGDYYAYYF